MTVAVVASGLAGSRLLSKTFRRGGSSPARDRNVFGNRSGIRPRRGACASAATGRKARCARKRRHCLATSLLPRLAVRAPGVQSLWRFRSRLRPSNRLPPTVGGVPRARRGASGAERVGGEPARRACRIKSASRGRAFELDGTASFATSCSPHRPSRAAHPGELRADRAPSCTGLRASRSYASTVTVVGAAWPLRTEWLERALTAPVPGPSVSPAAPVTATIERCP